MKKKYNRFSLSYRIKMWFYRLDKNDANYVKLVLGECFAAILLFGFAFVFLALLLG